MKLIIFDDRNISVLVEQLSKNKQKWIRSLRQKKHRDEEGVFLVEGEKMVLEGLEFFQDELVQLVVLKGNENLIPEPLNAVSAFVNEKEFEQITELKTPNKLLAVFRRKPSMQIQTVKTIVLDGVQDPGNMGTILRLADWFGIQQVVCSNDTVDRFNTKVIQSSMGAIFRIEVFYTDLADFLKNSKQAKFGALLNGIDYKSVDYPKDAILILGNEGKGIRPEIENYIDTPVTIPRYGAAESLNVSTAAAILLAEMV